MARIILVHGAWHGAWCYRKVVDRLETAGHDVRAIDLPGHAGNGKPGWGVGLETYARAVLDAVGEAAPAHLVGHSMGGLVISRAAELAPQRAAGLVYLTAFMPRPNDRLLHLGTEVPGSLVPEVARPDFVAGVLRADARKAKPAFYDDCSDDDVALALRSLTPQPLGPMLARVRVTPERFGKTRRSYIFCDQDRAIPLAMQQRMAERVGVSDSVTLAASHSPFFSEPDAVAGAIDRFVRSGSA